MVKRFPLLLVFCGIIAGSAVAGERSGYKQDEFAIGFWVDPPADAKLNERYRQIAEAHFNLAILAFGTQEVNQKAAILEQCKRHHIKVVLFAANTPANALMTDPEIIGYGLQDEPGAADFAALAARADRIRKEHPGKAPFVNLFPSYADKALGVNTYDKYVKRFCDIYKPEILCMDHYPYMHPDRDTRDAYCADLAVLRTYALRDNIPFWNFFNTMPFGGHSDPTEGQLRWQVYASIAYGAKGVLYFCYYTPRSNEFPKGGAIIACNDRPTRHYDQAKRLNTELKQLGPTLMKLTSIGVYRIKPTDDPATVLAGTPITNLKREPHDPAHDMLMGVFAHADGRRAVLLMNYRHAFTAWPTVEFAADCKNIVEVSKTTGKEIPLTDDSPDMPGIQLSLDAGEGRLFLFDQK